MSETKNEEERPRVIVRLYTIGNLSACLCDRCATTHGLAGGPAPMVPAIGCSRCSSLNLARMLQPGWQLSSGLHPFGGERTGTTPRMFVE